MPSRRCKDRWCYTNGGMTALILERSVPSRAVLSVVTAFRLRDNNRDAIARAIALVDTLGTSTCTTRKLEGNEQFAQ